MEDNIQTNEEATQEDRPVGFAKDLNWQVRLLTFPPFRGIYRGKSGKLKVNDPPFHSKGYIPNRDRTDENIIAPTNKYADSLRGGWFGFKEKQSGDETDTTVLAGH